MKLCVFSNDPIKSYYEKVEIKTWYFNPDKIIQELLKKKVKITLANTFTVY